MARKKKGMKYVPFQCCRNNLHQIRSALAPASMWMKWWGAWTRKRSRNSCRWNTWPCGIIVSAWDTCRWPRSEYRSRLIQERRVTHCCKVSYSLASLSVGRHNSNLSKLTRIPKVKVDAAPSVLCAAIGIPSLVGVCSDIVKILSPAGWIKQGAGNYPRSATDI